jgi:alpha-N-arabinofuranosidase
VELIVRASAERYVFGYRIGNGGGQREVADFGSAPTAPLSSEDAGGFTGVVLGMVAHGADGATMPPADFDWFDYRPLAKNK